MISLVRLRDDLLSARKAKDAVAVGLLNPLVSEAAMVGKNAKPSPRETTDQEVLSMVKKFLDNLRDGLPHVEARAKDGDAEGLARHLREIEILEGYMPRQLDEGQLREAITAFAAQNPGAEMKQVMGFLKERHAGAYDGKSASALAKEILAKAA